MGDIPLDKNKQSKTNKLHSFSISNKLTHEVVLYLCKQCENVMMFMIIGIKDTIFEMACESMDIILFGDYLLQSCLQWLS